MRPGLFLFQWERIIFPPSLDDVTFSPCLIYIILYHFYFVHVSCSRWKPQWFMSPDHKRWMKTDTPRSVISANDKDSPLWVYFRYMDKGGTDYGIWTWRGGKNRRHSVGSNEWMNYLAGMHAIDPFSLFTYLYYTYIYTHVLTFMCSYYWKWQQKREKFLLMIRLIMAMVLVHCTLIQSVSADVPDENRDLTF